MIQRPSGIGYYDIVVVRITNEGKATSASIIPKAQVSTIPLYYFNASFGMIQDGKLLHFIYLDDAAPNAAMQWSTVDENGKVTTHKDWCAAIPATIPIPNHGLQLDAKTYLLPAEKGGKFRLGMVKLY